MFIKKQSLLFFNWSLPVQSNRSKRDFSSIQKQDKKLSLVCLRFQVHFLFLLRNAALMFSLYIRYLRIIQECIMKKFYIKKQFFVTSNDQNLKDSYQILDMIGRGSFGIVYKAKMRYYPYSVRAIKRIRKKYVKNPSDIIREYSILTSLDHPQIIKIYQTFQDEQNFYIVTDFCQGGQLFDQLQKKGNFSQMDARLLFTQMVNIIKYCHQNNVMHRDLKPENFLLMTKDSLNLMLIDFGLAFRWNKNSKEELIKKQGRNNIIGTAYYISPQIFTGQYDQRCDIWSLGIILFMLTTGQPPVSGVTTEEVLNNIKNGKINFQSLNTKKLSSSLTELILKILNPAEQRISLKDIITHPWMSIKLSDKKLNINFEKIRNYSKFSKFKVLVLNYIASQLSQKDIMLLGKLFLQVDKNKDGYLTVQELSNYMQSQQTRQEYADIRDIIQSMDVDHNGKLAYNEFISACLSKSAANNKQYLRSAFRYFDLNHDGKVSKEELAIILRSYKKQYFQNSNLIDQLLKECDLNQDNQIDFQEFCSYIMDKE